MKGRLYRHEYGRGRYLTHEYRFVGEAELDNCEPKTLADALEKKHVMPTGIEYNLYEEQSERETSYIIADNRGWYFGKVVVPKTITIWKGKTLYVSIFLKYTGQHVCSFLADKLEKTETRFRFSFMEGITPYEDDVNVFDEICVRYVTREIPWYEAELERLDRYPEEERDDWWYEAKAEAEDAKRFANSE